MKKRKPFNQEAAIRGALRRVFSRSPVIWDVLRSVRREVPRINKDGSRAKKDAVQYLCNVCKQYVGSTMVAVDHIIPVISVDDGFVDFNTFIQRLFCEASNLQVICDECHQQKTNAERTERNRKKDLEALAELASRLSSLSLKEAKRELKRYTGEKKHADVRSMASTLRDAL
jgi:5-methylcytosine-specific restriction endonuclease McrA